MHNITLKIESPTGRSFTRKEVSVGETPRIGEKVNLGPLFDLKSSESHHAKVSSVLHTVTRFGDKIPPVVVFDASDVGRAVMEKVQSYWEEHHTMDDR